MLAFGEVRTGLLQHSTPLPAARATEILALVRGLPVRRSDRPTAYAVSPPVLTGVDCALPTGSAAGVRAIGTVASRAVLHGGHVLQGSSQVRLVPGDGIRHRWPYYLARPGVVAAESEVDWRGVAAGIAARVPAPATLDLGAISEFTIAQVNRSSELDARSPLRVAPRTRLRWLMRTADGPATVHFRVESPVLRTVLVTMPEPALDRVAEFCEDLALHDWLLTALLGLIERSRIGAAPRSEVVSRLSVAVDYLIHLWMPAARIRGALAALWHELERDPGFTRQWDVSVRRIRDQLAIGAATRPVQAVPATPETKR
jgi:hypothetical protein